MRINLDMHIHTVLSPCSDWSMSPKSICEKAKDLNLDVISVTDHNAIQNIPAAIDAGRESGVTVIPGIEMQTREEVHILGYFSDIDRISAFYSEYHLTLPKIKNDPEKNGSQVIVNKDDDVLAECPYFLVVSSELSVEQTIDLIHKHKGIAIAAHVDRKAYSMISQLGFVPKDIELDGIEMFSGRIYEENIPKICSSDAHSIDQIGLKFSQAECEENEIIDFNMFREKLRTHSVKCSIGGK